MDASEAAMHAIAEVSLDWVPNAQGLGLLSGLWWAAMLHLSMSTIHDLVFV